MIQRSLPLGRPRKLQDAAQELKAGKRVSVQVGDSIEYLIYVIGRLEQLSGVEVDFTFDHGNPDLRTMTVWPKGQGDGS